MSHPPVAIAIDGPAGAGKSTLSRRLAQSLRYLYVDTGALYRAIGLHIHRCGADPDDAQAVQALLADLRISLSYKQGTQCVLLNGKDVTALLRTPEISEYASRVSAQPAVRAFLLSLQRELAQKHNVVMDGRDIGTVVLPQAQIKIFLTADVRDRAQRRHAELRSRGVHTPFEEVLADMRVRDARDTERAVSPLRQAEDALLLDTTGNSFQQSLEALTSLVKERLTHVV